MAPVEPDKTISTELIRATKGPSKMASLIIGSILLILAVIFVTHLITADNIRRVTSARYEFRIENVEAIYEAKIKRMEEATRIAMDQQELQIDHANRLAELARAQDEGIRFEIALADAIVELQPKLDKRSASRIVSVVVDECKEKGLDPLLVTALIWVESGFNSMAHSNKGAVGLMQVRYSVWKKTNTLKDNGVSAKHKLYWTDLNIKCGTTILAEYYEAADHDIAEALYRYNTGSKTIPKEVNRYEILYVNKIIRSAYFISECIRNEKGKSE